MPKLVDLQIEEVSGVDRPANKRKFLVIKRADPLPEGEEVPAEVIEKRVAQRGNKWVVLSESGKVLGTHDTRAEAVQQLRAVEASKHRRTKKQALLDAVSKILGWPEEPIDKAADDQPPTFTESLMREKMDEVMEDLSDHVWALRSTLYGVLASAQTNKAELVTAALDQFKASAGGCVTRWLAGDSVEKAGRKISAERLTRLKEMSETLSRLIAEAEGTPTAKREEDEGMPTQEEFDAILKRLETVEAKAGEADTLKKQLEDTNAKLTAAEEKVAKAEQTAEQEKDLRETQENIAIAKRLGLNPDDAVTVIKSLRTKDPESWAWVEKHFNALRAQVKAGTLFKSQGREGTTTPAASAVDEAFRRAEELVAKDAKLTDNDALAKVFRDDPELYRKYTREASITGTDRDEGDE